MDLDKVIMNFYSRSITEAVHMETAFSNSFIISWRSCVKYFLGWTKLDQNCVENQHSKWDMLYLNILGLDTLIICLIRVLHALEIQR